MSGPKGCRVRVESAEERLRRDTAATIARCHALSDKLAGLRAVVVADVPTVSAPPVRVLPQLREWESRLLEAVRAAEKAKATESASTRLASIRSTVGATVLKDVSLGLHKSATKSRLSERIDHLLVRASEIEDVHVLTVLADKAGVLKRLDGVEQQRALASLNADIAREVKRHRVQVRIRASAEEEALALAHLDVQVTAPVMAAAANANTQADLLDVRVAIKRLLDRAEKVEDATFITEQARQVLIELGYMVDPPFEVVDHAGNAFLARREDLPDHALQVQVNPESGTMLTNIVAVEGTSAEEDSAAESATCEDVLSMPSALAPHGVVAELAFHRSAGAVPAPHTLTSFGAIAPVKASKKRVTPKALGLKP